MNSLQNLFFKTANRFFSLSLSESLGYSYPFVRGLSGTRRYQINCMYPKYLHNQIIVLCEYNSDIDLLKRELQHQYPTVNPHTWQIGFCNPIHPLQAVAQPLIEGQAIRHELLNGYGTFGGYVADQNNWYGISNNHVIADTNNPFETNSIFNTNGEWVGNLDRFIRLLSPPAINNMDVALFHPFLYPPLNSRQAFRCVPITINEGDLVYKIGARTGYREGVIEATDVIENISYPRLGLIQFRAGLSIVRTDGLPFSDAGDSGSLVFRKSDHKWVGINFAGNGILSFANRADLVAQALGLSFYLNPYF